MAKASFFFLSLHAVNPAMVTDIRQPDDNCCLMAETQVSVTDDDNRQLLIDGWVWWKVTRLKPGRSHAGVVKPKVTCSNYFQMPIIKAAVWWRRLENKNSRKSLLAVCLQSSTKTTGFVPSGNWCFWLLAKCKSHLWLYKVSFSTGESRRV